MTTQKELNGQLIEAAKKGDKDAVKALLDAGADVNARRRKAWFVWAPASMRAAVVGPLGAAFWLFLAVGSLVLPFEALWGRGEMDMARWMFGLFASGLASFSVWVVCGDCRVGDLLVRFAAVALIGAAVFLMVASVWEALEMGVWWRAILWGVVSAPLLFFMLGCAVEDVLAANRRSWTPLMIAAERGRTDAAIALVEAGANVKARDWFGRTALKIAEKHGHADTARAIEDAARKRAGRR